MPRKFTEDTLVIASHNPGKIAEIKALLAPFNVTVKGGPSFNIEEPEENEDTFLGNARIKSEAFAKATFLPALSDDSGLVVPSLDGAPGIYSARWAGADKDFSAAMKRVKHELIEATGDAQGEAAYFVCALSLCWPDGHVEEVEGRVHGHLTFPPRGERGFGYDPIFVPEGYTETFGEMNPDIKHEISHRSNAFNALIKKCF